VSQSYTAVIKQAGTWWIGWIEEVPAERYLRWARYGPLGGGTPHIQRNGIARHLLGDL